jgi:hypothetical protein
LLAFDLIQYIVPTTKVQARLRGDEMLAYFRDEGVKVSTSLDGPAFLQNKNRPRLGNDSYERAIDGIDRARRILGYENVAALMTTTAASLDHVTEIINEYVRRDFHTIFLRPISPYGFAVKTKNQTGYEMERRVSDARRNARLDFSPRQCASRQSPQPVHERGGSKDV